MPETLEYYRNLIAQQHRDRTKFLSTVDALCGSCVSIQDVLYGLISAFDVDNAAGDQLDIIGLWVGLSRAVSIPLDGYYFEWGDAVNPTKTGWGYGVWKGTGDPTTGIETMNDQMYRSMLKAKIKANHWNGDKSGCYEILRAILGDSPQIIITGAGTPYDLGYTNTTGNALTITDNGFDNPTFENTIDNQLTIAALKYYAATLGKGLTVAYNGVSDATYSATASNALTVSANSTPHYIAATLGDTLTITTSMLTNYVLNAATYTFVDGDAGKSVKVINASGDPVGVFSILSVDIDGNAGCSRSSGSQGAGTITGGLWGFSTETVIDAGDYILTAASSKFSAGDAGTKSIQKIDSAGASVAVWAIVKYTSGTVVGANLSSGTSGSASAGKWDYSTATITYPYTLTAGSAYFGGSDVTKTFRVINAAGTRIADFLVLANTSSTINQCSLSAGSAPASAVGGEWDFSTASQTSGYSLSSESAYFEAGDVGSNLITTWDWGTTISEYEIDAFITSTIVWCSVVSGTQHPTTRAGGRWDFSTASMTYPFTLACASNYFSSGSATKSINIIADGAVIALFYVAVYTDQKTVQCTLTSGTAPASAAGGKWDFSDETITEYTVATMNQRIRIIGATELQQAIIEQNLVPVKPAGIAVEYIFE